MKYLTISNIERQNVLNNRFVVSKVQEYLDIEGMLFEGEYRFTKKMVADFYEVEERTIERYLEKYSDELSANGYVLCKGKHLKKLKLQFAPDIYDGSKTTQIRLFNFRSFLNIGMLLTESERAKKVRSLILDFVQNDLYYPTFADKLTYLMYRFCSGHFFNDGNKRIALTLGAYFLRKNNYYWHACICMCTLESIIYHVAASNIDQDLLLRIINSFMTGKDYDEELKIDIANAMSKGKLGI